jgi:hypothetical protein
MKTFGAVTFMITGLVLLAQPVLGVPRAEGGSHFSGAASRLVGEGTHRSSFEARSSSAFQPHSLAGTRSRIISQRSRLAVATETFNHLGGRFGSLRNPGTTASGAQSRRFERQGLDERNRLFAREVANWHRDWDQHRDHFWRGHRCRFVNGTWIILDEGFYPYDFYPYGYYPYEHSDENYDVSSYESRGWDLIVLEVQVALQMAGYDSGSADGVVDPGTRDAISRYQRDHGLDVTGKISEPVLRALGLN